MPQNIEIKARARDFPKQCSIAAQLADGPGEVIHQEDIFYHVPRGRLKLRIFNPQRGELIAYDRPNQQGPKTSQYSISPTQNPASLDKVLQDAMSLRGVVRKQRTIYLVGQTRIHLDEVEQLGSYLELEVVMKEGQTSDHGKQIATALMDQLGIADEDLIDKAYIDLLEENQV